MHIHRQNEPTYNAGNFQEYDYETEWLECDWKAVHKTLHLVSAFWYPWLYKPVNYNI